MRATEKASDEDQLNDVLSPIFREVVCKEFWKLGFRKAFAVLTSTSSNNFFSNHAEGRLFWDQVFEDRSHGTDTHTIQLLYVFRAIENEFYMYMGGDGQKIWNDVFDGLAYDSPSRPEWLGPVLTSILPLR